ncbi:MAG: hypothetical protein K9L82_03820 [Chromatiaceae bacterium]|nr:hypothetical protein [Chromatiaceae bacterium]MCF7993408.1 hypothetical protein [Chromatiaceae bacterium]MCF8015501.1 hypothetical protein [Chromatiaceae bacterium]
MPRKQQTMSSRELLNRIGLGDEAPPELLDETALEDLEGDLGAVLRERFALLTQHNVFQPGDLVGWKPGLRNRKVPTYETPAIVIEVLDEPILDKGEESGSAYYREPHDLILGMIWDREPGRGHFVTFHYDSRRFQPWQG